jgi:geranylgeranylglycerol-phosphate geranylgeranyltransferase
LGFGEVTKNLFYLNRDSAPSLNAFRKELYLQGANWSGIVFPTLFLLSPAFFVEMDFFPVVSVVYVFVLFWLMLDPRQKTSWLALFFGFAVGYGTPIAFIASIAHLTDFFTPPITDQSPFQTLLALIALVGFMAGFLRLSKDLFGLKLDKFVLNLWNRHLYSLDAACLFLLLAVSQLVCIVLTFAWFVLFLFQEGPSGNSYAARLTLVGVAVVVLSVIAVLMTIFRPKKLAATIHEAEQINTMKPEDQVEAIVQNALLTVHRWARNSQLFMRSGRLGVSWIAGFAPALIVFRSSSIFWPNALIAFFSMTLVTMAGFVMNDISDLQKDRLAGKRRPIALGQLSVELAWRGVVVTLAAAIGSAYLVFGFAPALWIVSIAVALFVYSPVARQWPLIKGLYTALLATTPFLFAYDVAGFALPAISLALLLSYMVFREAVLDVMDLKGDISAGVHTVAFFLGERQTQLIGWVGMFATLFVAVAVMNTLGSRIAMTIGLIFQTVAVVMFYFRIPHSLSITRITLLSGVLAVALADN